jgi:hypothetical protein
MRIACLAALLALASPPAGAYSVLSHEAVVDALWDASIQKMLLKRFPSAAPDALKQAHAYAYGGCIIQDLGYYPFSNRLFSDLTHYVRSGDFIEALIRDSQDLNEYAFALGALSHYAADATGHRLATNLAVPMLYPKLRKRFGMEVTYWDNPLAHSRTEFGFDALQVGHGRYAPDSYRAFIGFQVAKPLMERAFQDTYGIPLKDVFGTLDLALGTFRYSVGSILPGMTRVAWELKKDEFIQEIPGITKKKFLYNLSRSSYEKEWGKQYRRPGTGARFVAWILRIVPKFGPLKALEIRTPTPEVEKMFMGSFNATVDRYRALLTDQDDGHAQLENENFDVGAPTPAGKYAGTDHAYDTLLGKLADGKFTGVSEALKADILGYYKDRKPPPGPATKKASDEWDKLTGQLEQLREIQHAP